MKKLAIASALLSVLAVTGTAHAYQAEVDHGFLFDAPANVIAEFPQFPPLHGYEALKQAIRSVSQRNIPE